MEGLPDHPWTVEAPLPEIELLRFDDRGRLLGAMAIDTSHTRAFHLATPVPHQPSTHNPSHESHRPAEVPAEPDPPYHPETSHQPTNKATTATALPFPEKRLVQV